MEAEVAQGLGPTTRGTPQVRVLLSLHTRKHTALGGLPAHDSPTREHTRIQFDTLPLLCSLLRMRRTLSAAGTCSLAPAAGPVRAAARAAAAAAVRGRAACLRAAWRAWPGCCLPSWRCWRCCWRPGHWCCGIREVGGGLCVRCTHAHVCVRVCVYVCVCVKEHKENVACMCVCIGSRGFVQVVGSGSRWLGQARGNAPSNAVPSFLLSCLPGAVRRGVQAARCCGARSWPRRTCGRGCRRTRWTAAAWRSAVLRAGWRCWRSRTRARTAWR